MPDDDEEQFHISEARGWLASAEAGWDNKSRRTKEAALIGILHGILGLHDELIRDISLSDEELEEQGIKDAVDIMPSSLDLNQDQQSWTKLSDVTGDTGKHAKADDDDVIEAFKGAIPKKESTTLDSGDPTAKQPLPEDSSEIWCVYNLSPDLGMWDLYIAFFDDREAFNYIDGLPPESWRVQPMKVYGKGS